MNATVLVEIGCVYMMARRGLGLVILFVIIFHSLPVNNLENNLIRIDNRFGISLSTTNDEARGRGPWPREALEAAKEGMKAACSMNEGNHMIGMIIMNRKCM